MEKHTKALLAKNGLKTLDDLQNALDNPDIGKCTIRSVLVHIKSMDLSTRKELKFSDRTYIPAIHCKDGIIFPVRDATGGTTGTFASLDDDNVRLIIKPNYGSRK